MKRVLLLGGTGAMGVYLQTELLQADDTEVFVTSRTARETTCNRLSFIQGNARDEDFLARVTMEKWDAIVDFMVRPSATFNEVSTMLLRSTKQYVFISSYRVFADSPVIRESSPRLLDVCRDAAYLKTDEYALAKARQEDVLRHSGFENWTIVRPAITYSRDRFQLCSMEAEEWLWRAIKGHKVVLPAEMMTKESTLSWGGDVARMISRLIGNPKAFKEDFNVSTNQHQSWFDVLGAYKKIIDFDVLFVPLEDYAKIVGRRDQIRFDRMFNRVLDNSKVLSVTGLDGSSLLDIEDGLSRELPEHLSKGGATKVSMLLQAQFDKATGEYFMPGEMGCGLSSYLRYVMHRMI